MIPALAAAIGPILQAAGLSGGTATAAAASGSSAGMAGIGRALAGVMGGAGRAAPLGSTQEIGAVVQQISDWGNAAAAAKSAMGSIGGEIRSINDPNGPQLPKADAQNRIGELMRQRQERAAELEAHRKSIHESQSRIDATLTPPAPPTPPGHQALQAGAAGLGMAHMLPGIIKGLPGVAAIANIPAAGAQAFGSVAMHQSDRAVMGSMANFGADTAKTALNPMAIARGELHLQMAKLPGLLQEWGQGLVESKRHLMAYSGALHEAFRMEEFRTVNRDMASARATGGATAGLSDAMQDLYDEVRPIKDAVTIVLTRTVELGVRSLTVIAQGIITVVSNMPVISAAASAVIDWLAGDVEQKGQVPLLDFMATAAKMRESMRRNKPRPGR